MGSGPESTDKLNFYLQSSVAGSESRLFVVRNQTKKALTVEYDQETDSANYNDPAEILSGIDKNLADKLRFFLEGAVRATALPEKPVQRHAKRSDSSQSHADTLMHREGTALSGRDVDSVSLTEDPGTVPELSDSRGIIAYPGTCPFPLKVTQASRY